MASLLDTLAEQYDMVVIDTPPITIVPDAIPLISQADGTIVVVRTNRTRRDWAKRLQTQLTDLDARVLGLVVNGVANQDYGYGYGYAYQGQLASVPGSTDGEGDSTPVGAAERGG
jgi:Mrp family chromosome partitioning ATPase